MDFSTFDPLQLDERDFIVDPNAQNICFLPLPIFTRISEMLSPSDFYKLARTCRYMHWRMFTYGHLMLKHHHIINMASKENSIIKEAVTIEGRLKSEIIVHRPYVYFKYLHLQFVFCDHSSPFMFDKMIDYVIKAKKRTKHYCIEIINPKHVCTQETFQDINNLIERLNPFYLQLCFSWNDHKLTVKIPNIKNVYSVYLLNMGFLDGFYKETDFLMNPFAGYAVYTVQDLCDIVQEFTKNSRLQFHFCFMMIEDPMQCRAMLEKGWNLKFEEADETLRNHFYFSESDDIPLYASIPSEYGNVEIFISSSKVVIQRKETYIGQWNDFYRKVRGYD